MSSASIHGRNQRKRLKQSQDNRLDEFSTISPEQTPLYIENKIERLKHFVNTYELSCQPRPFTSESKKEYAPTVTGSNEKPVMMDQEAAVISLLEKHSGEISNEVMPSWFSSWAEKKEKVDRNFQEDMRDILEAILRKLQPPELRAPIPADKKPSATIQDCLPLRTMLEFKLFNERLCEELGFKHSFINYLNSLKASSTKQAMVGFFAKCMDDELMCNFTWAGHTRSKSELQSTPLAKCIVEVVRNLRALNNPPLIECQKYGSEAVRYANQRRNQWRTARGRGLQQFKVPIIQYETDFTDRHDEVDIEERVDITGCDQEKFGTLMPPSSVSSNAVLPHPGSSVSIVSQQAVSPYLLPPHATVSLQPYSQGLKRKVQPLAMSQWTMQDHTPYQQGKVSMTRSVPGTTSMGTHSTKRQHPLVGTTVPQSSAGIPIAHQASIMPSNPSHPTT